MDVAIDLKKFSELLGEKEKENAKPGLNVFRIRNFGTKDIESLTVFWLVEGLTFSRVLAKRRLLRPDIHEIALTLVGGRENPSMRYPVNENEIYGINKYFLSSLDQGDALGFAYGYAKERYGVPQLRCKILGYMDNAALKSFMDVNGSGFGVVKAMISCLDIKPYITEDTPLFMTEPPDWRIRTEWV